MNNTRQLFSIQNHHMIDNIYPQKSNSYHFVEPVIKFDHFSNGGNEDMRVKCKCGAKGKITHSDPVSDEITRLYVDCTECHTRFCSLLSFEKTLLPSRADSLEWLRGLISEIPPEERQALLRL